MQNKIIFLFYKKRGLYRGEEKNDTEAVSGLR